MDDHWPFEVEPDKDTASTSGRRRQRGPSEVRGRGTDDVQAGRIELLSARMERLIAQTDDHYLMLEGHLCQLELELHSHKIGPYADPQQYIVNRIVKPHPNLADDLDVNTQLKLLAWLYRIHDPRIEKSVAEERAIRSLTGD